MSINTYAAPTHHLIETHCQQGLLIDGYTPIANVFSKALERPVDAS